MRSPGPKALTRRDQIVLIYAQDMATFYDPQTSGGLLVAAAPSSADAVGAELEAAGGAWRIGVVEAPIAGARVLISSRLCSSTGTRHRFTFAACLVLRKPNPERRQCNEVSLPL